MDCQTLRPLRLPTCLILLLTLFVPGYSWSTTYWVSTEGSDSNTCETASGSDPLAAQAKRNITGANGAIACVVAGNGDSVVIRTGTYDETITTNNQYIPSGTSYANAMTIRAHTDEAVVLNGGIAFEHVGYVIVQDLRITNGVWADTTTGADNSHHIRWVNLDVTHSEHNVAQGGADNLEFIGGSYHDAPSGTDPCGGGPCYGMYLNGNDLLIDGVKVYGNAGYGLHLYHAMPPYPERITVMNSEIYNNGEVGLLVANGDGHNIYNNVVWNNGLAGIDVAYGATNVTVMNNTSVGNGTYGISASNATGTVMNNIFQGNADVGFICHSNCEIAESNNLF